MHYINNPKQNYLTYDEAVAVAIQAGIDAKRAYIYLAGLNIRGERFRIMGDNGYSKPIKLAVQGDAVISSMAVCEHCTGVIVNVS